MQRSNGGIPRQGDVSSQRSILESYPDKIASAPNQPALSGGTKIIERQFEIWREYVEAIELDPGADLGEVADLATKYAALSAKE